MPRYKEHNPITTSIDILFTILIFWALLQWGASETFEAKTILFFLYLIIVNDWLSCRATYEFYTSEMFVIDVIIIFLFLRMIDAVTSSVEHLSGYNIVFWLELGFLSLLYGFWDYVVSAYTGDKQRKKELKAWGNKMFVVALLCVGSFVALYWMEKNLETRTLLFLAAEAPSFLVFVALIILWNKQKFQLYKELERGLRKPEKEATKS